MLSVRGKRYMMTLNLAYNRHFIYIYIIAGLWLNLLKLFMVIKRSCLNLAEPVSGLW